MSLSKLLALLGPASVLLASLALAGPLDRRQAAISDDLETLGQLDPVRSGKMTRRNCTLQTNVHLVSHSR